MRYLKLSVIRTESRMGLMGAGRTEKWGLTLEWIRFGKMKSFEDGWW